MADLPGDVLGDRDLLFVSYSHADAGWAQRFEVLLKPLVHHQRLEIWMDSAIHPGDEWRPEIDQAIGRSRVALLLVSADFLASDFIVDHELPALIAHRVRLAPVLVGECLWKQMPELAGVQWLHDPGRDGALALDADHPGRRDRRIRLACECLLGLVQDSAPAPIPQLVTSSRPVASAIEAIEAIGGGLSLVPPLPPGYVVREELDPLIEQLIDVAAGGAVGLTGRSAGVGLHGIGGIGKTVMATALARDERIRRRFPHGVYWVTVGEQPDLLALQLGLLARLVDRVGLPPRTVPEATARLRQVVADRQLLVVVDDVWSDAAAHAFRITGPRCRLLYTSRDEQVIAAVGATHHQISVLSLDTARMLAAGILETPAVTLPPEADHAFAQVGMVPLAVALLSAAVRGGRSWDQVAAALDGDTDVYGDHPYANTFRAMHIATTALPAPLRDALLGLAVFPPDTEIPVAAVVRYWAKTRRHNDAQTHADLERLAAANLLRRDRDSIGFHDLQYEYLLLHAPTLALLHTELLAAYRVLLPNGQGDQWWRLPDTEPYVWDHLVEHLGGAGERRTLAKTVTDAAYHVQRITYGGPHASERDLALATRFLPDNWPVAWWRGWLARHSHLLGRRTNHDIQQRRCDIAATVKAWLDAEPHRPPDLQIAGLMTLLSRPYLAITNGLSAPADGVLRILTGHTARVDAVAWSPDGARLATASDELVRIWDPITGQTTTTLTDHIDRVFALAWSPDGARLATAADSVVRIWDQATGQTITALTGHIRGLNAVAWSPDGTRLAAASDDRVVRIWDPATGQTTSTLTGHTRGSNAVAWSPDGTRLATASNDPTVRIWDSATGQTITTLTGHIHWVRAVAWSPDGTRLATASNDPIVRIWDPATGQTITNLTGHTNGVNAVAWSPNGSRIATAGNDRVVRIWDPSMGQITTGLFGHTDRVRAVAWSADGTRLATAGDDETVRIWDPATAHTTTPTGHAGWIRAVAWSGDGTRLATAGDDETVRIWDPATDQTALTLTGHSHWVRTVAWSPDSTRLATAGDDRVVRVWDPTTGQTTIILSGHTNGVNAVAWSPDGTRLATAGDDRTVRIWDPTTGHTTMTLAGIAGWVKAAAWSPDGNHLATAGDDRVIQVWDATIGQNATTLTGHTGWVKAVVWSPDGARIATAGDDRVVRIWDPTTGQTTVTLTGHTGWICAVAWSPDGARLATADDGGMIILWTHHGRELTSVNIQEARSLAWSMDKIAVGRWGRPVIIKVIETEDAIT